ncbi:MAG: hypothetical protein OIF57_18260, partial [Marinobacterium sp.]|nr:hypothetical protein [Marinobacterium sp.]
MQQNNARLVVQTLDARIRALLTVEEAEPKATEVANSPPSHDELIAEPAPQQEDADTDSMSDPVVEAEIDETRTVEQPDAVPEPALQHCQPFWQAFDSRFQAQGFASRLQQTTGLSLGLADDSGVYRICLLTENGISLAHAEQIINDKTGLSITTSTRHREE